MIVLDCELFCISSPALHHRRDDHGSYACVWFDRALSAQRTTKRIKGVLNPTAGRHLLLALCSINFKCTTGMHSSCFLAHPELDGSIRCNLT